jgi:phage terminase large subunit GpA-like protein
MIPAAAPRLASILSRALAPRVPLSVSQWADAERFVSSKGSAKPGKWSTDRNPVLREPMDAMSVRSTVHDVTCMFPIQIGKTEIAINVLGYTMDHAPGPIMVALPGEVSQKKWIAQKLNPALEVTPAMQQSLTSTATRDGANQRDFKDFNGGQLYIEHGGSPQRLKSTTVKILIVDELDEFAANLKSGDDPVAMLDGRTSAFPSTYKRLYISTPGIEGVSRIKQLYQASDQRRYYVPCPHCGHMQALEWRGLHWNPDATECWYVCGGESEAGKDSEGCGACIEEHHKTQMIRFGRWVAENPVAPSRGYTLNGLYYQFGLGPRWLDLVREFRAAQGDPAKLKTFINDRLAETFEDPAMRAVKHNLIADRAEPVPMRPLPAWVLAATAGIDTQDNRLAVHVTGWGRGLASWTIDYVELHGDPAEEDVWLALQDLLLRPLDHALGGQLRVEACAIDIGGHRTEAVKAWVRKRLVRRTLAIFGAVPNNAPVLGKGKLQDINWRGQLDKRGVHIHAVGTVAIKHLLYSRLSTDADKQPDARLVRFSEQLSADYFGGLTAETYNPAKNRFEKRRGAPRNEPLDTWVYSYAATHHPELRLHRHTKAEWDAREARLRVSESDVPRESSAAGASHENAPQETQSRHGTARRRPGGFATNW